MVLFLARPYIAGQTAEQSVALAHKIYREHHFTSTLDILGEDMESDSTCDASVKAYKELADQIAAKPLKVKSDRLQLTISLKPSMFSTKAPGEPGADNELLKAYERIKAVTEYAGCKNINVTLDAEDHRWTDFQLATYANLIKQGCTNLGTVLQSRLLRTRDDLKKFDSGMRVRLVIGIYNEPATIALTDKTEMKQMLVEYAGILLAKGVYVEIATHDLDCIHSFFTDVVIPNKIPSTTFELQFLHGVPRDQLQNGLETGSYFTSKAFPEAYAGELARLNSEGARVRKYLPFGLSHVAGAYCRRRLKENPNMITYGIKNFLGFQS